MGARLRYFLRMAWMNVRGERTATLLTLLVITISFVIFGAFLLLGLNVAGFFDHFAGHVQIVFTLKDDANADQIGRLVNGLRGESAVAAVRYISPQEALERMRRDLIDAPEFLEGLSDSPIPASVEVEMRAGLHERPDLRPIVGKYRPFAGVESVDAGDEFSEAFARVLAGLWFWGGVVAVFLTLSAVFIVANTIRLTIIRRRGEIENMRLVGATNAFVNAPFLIEGVAMGLCGAAGAVAILYAVYRMIVLPSVLDAAVMSVLTGFDPRFLDSGMLAAALALGAFVGWLGAQMSVGRYLKAR